MTTADRLIMLKIDLGISSTAYDSRLEQFLESAVVELERIGILINEDSISDNQLVVSYARYKWQQRQNGGAMPRDVQFAIHCRLINEKGKA